MSISPLLPPHPPPPGLASGLTHEFFFADGHQTGDEPRARKRCRRPDCERARAHTATLYLVFCRTAPADRRLSCLTIYPSLPPPPSLFVTFPHPTLCTSGDGICLACVHQLRVPCWCTGVAYRELPRGCPYSSRPFPSLLLSHNLRIMVFLSSSLLSSLLRSQPNVLYRLPYFRSGYLNSTIDALLRLYPIRATCIYSVYQTSNDALDLGG